MPYVRPGRRRPTGRPAGGCFHVEALRGATDQPLAPETPAWSGLPAARGRGPLGERSGTRMQERRRQRPAKRGMRARCPGRTPRSHSLGLARVPAAPGERDRRPPVPAACASGARAAGAAPGCAPARLRRAPLTRRSPTTRRLTPLAPRLTARRQTRRSRRGVVATARWPHRRRLRSRHHHPPSCAPASQVHPGTSIRARSASSRSG